MKRLFVVTALAILMWACSSSPTSPGSSYAVSGVVSALMSTGLVGPVEGVLVGSDSPVGTTNGATSSATTDKNGLYNLVVDGGVRSLLLTRPGYVTELKSVTVSGDTRFDMRIVRYATFTLSGIVSEAAPAGLTPVEGVEVYCDSCGDYGHTSAFTDVNGFYILADAHAGNTPLLVSKPGYQDSRNDVMINGDTQFHIEIVRR